MSTIRQGWRRASRRIVVGALAAAVLVLCWLSWQLVVQDRTLERQRVDERLRSTADLIAASLQRDVAAASDAVAQLSRGLEVDRLSLVRTLGSVGAAGVAAVITP